MFVTHPRGGDGASCVTVCLFSPPAVMKFMGDHPPRGQTELDIVCTLLKVNPVPWGWWQRGRPRPWSEPCLSPSCARSTRRCGTRCTARSSSSSPTTPAPSRESCWAGTAQPGWFWGQFSTLTPRGHPGIWGRPHPAVLCRSPGLWVLFQPPPRSTTGAQLQIFPAGTAARRAGGCSTSSPPTTGAPRCSGPSSWLSCRVPAGARSSLSMVGAVPTPGTFRGARRGPILPGFVLVPAGCHRPRAPGSAASMPVPISPRDLQSLRAKLQENPAVRRPQPVPQQHGAQSHGGEAGCPRAGLQIPPPNQDLG